MRLARGVVLLILTVSGLVGAEDTRVEVLTVRNRPAEDLVAALLPLAGPDGAVTSLENRLVVRATPTALAQIRSVLEQLDVAPRTLWITVRQATASTSQQRAGSVSGTVSGNVGSVRVSPDGAIVTTSSTRTRVSGAFDASSSQASGQDVQRLQALENRAAFIRVGEAVPVAGTTWAGADNGFWVLPSLAGSLVTLEIAVARDALGATGAVRERRAHSVVTGPLGEWLHVGGIASQELERAKAPLAGSSRADSADWNVELKVEAASAP